MCNYYTNIKYNLCSANIACVLPFKNNPLTPSSKLHTGDQARLEKSETKAIRPEITDDTIQVFNKSGFIETFHPELLQSAMDVLNTDTKEEHPNHLAAKDLQKITEKGEEPDISSLMLELEILATELVSGLDDEKMEIEDVEEELFKT